MDISFRTNKLEVGLSDEAQCRRRYGVPMARVIKRRLDGLYAAESLADFWPPKSLPERCHELLGDLAGTFSIDVQHPYRLLFVPFDDKPGEGELDEQQRWRAITSIEIVGIEDTHG